MGALNSTSPIQNSANSPTSPSDNNDSKITSEPTVKPRKFFKSRNAATSAEIQQQIAIQQKQQQQQQSQQHYQSNHVQASLEEHPVRSPKKSQKPQKSASPKKEKVVKLKVEKPPKVKKEKVPKVKEVVALPEKSSSDSDEAPLRRGRAANSESTRHSGRVRGKINYNEDEGEEEFIKRTEKRIAPRFLKGPQGQEKILQEDPEEQEPPWPEEAQNSPEMSNPALNHPPIVLRISKVRTEIFI